MASKVNGTALAPYDALLVLSYGGPNYQEEVIPFLRDITAQANIPVERLAAVGEHYKLFDGRSPINAENLALIAALRSELEARGSSLPILFGNVHWYPRTIDTLRSAVEFGARRFLVLITAAYASYSGSRKYREHLAGVRAKLAEEYGDRLSGAGGGRGADDSGGGRGDGDPGTADGGLQFDVLRPFFNDPSFIAANEYTISAAIERLDCAPDAPIHIAYVTHSIPEAMNAASGATGPTYLEQHELVRKLLDERLGAEPERHRSAEAATGSGASPGTSSGAGTGSRFTSSLSFCSRSGNPRTPWLAPDISDRLDELAAAGTQNVVLAPIGFIADHMEVVYDLDTVAREHGTSLGMRITRSGTAGSQPVFVRGIVDLMAERASRERGEPTRATVVGDLAPFPDEAPPESCRRDPGVVTGLPVLAGEED